MPKTLPRRSPQPTHLRPHPDVAQGILDHHHLRNVSSQMSPEVPCKLLTQALGLIVFLLIRKLQESVKRQTARTWFGCWAHGQHAQGWPGGPCRGRLLEPNAFRQQVGALGSIGNEPLLPAFNKQLLLETLWNEHDQVHRVRLKGDWCWLNINSLSK